MRAPHAYIYSNKKKATEAIDWKWEFSGKKSIKQWKVKDKKRLHSSLNVDGFDIRKNWCHSMFRKIHAAKIAAN